MLNECRTANPPPERSGVATPRCNSGNGVVLSAGNNAPTVAVQAGWGLAKNSWRNTREPPVNPVSTEWRKALGRHAKKQVVRRRCFYVAAPLLVAQPGEKRSQEKALKVDLTIPAKPVSPHRWREALYQGGIPRVIKGDGPAGRGRWRKQKLGCNG